MNILIFLAQNSDKYIFEYCNKEKHYVAERKALKELDKNLHP